MERSLSEGGVYAGHGVRTAVPLLRDNWIDDFKFLEPLSPPRTTTGSVEVRYSEAGSTCPQPITGQSQEPLSRYVILDGSKAVS